MLSTVNLTSSLKAYIRRAAILVLTFTLVVFAWTSSCFQTNMNANAATISGVSDRLEGTVDEYAGKMKRAKGDATDDLSEELEGGLQEAKGKAQQDLGIAKSKLDEVGDFIEEKSSDLVDSVEDFLD